MVLEQQSGGEALSADVFTVIHNFQLVVFRHEPTEATTMTI